jgi:starch synthase
VKIAFVTPELGSLVRRTSLAELADALPKALRQQGSDVRVFMPWSQDVSDDALEEVSRQGEVIVSDSIAAERFEIHCGRLGDVPVYLLDNSALFGTRHPYGNQEGPYPDNWRRYALFARAVLESLSVIDFAPDILHCVDWTTGMIPVLRQIDYVERRPEHPAASAGTFFAIHNLAMQGTFEREVLSKIGLPLRIFQNIGGVELGGKVNFLKAGAEFATILGTHSPGHAKRIQEQDRGYGLEEVFTRRSKELVGIANGIDYQAWDPSSDTLLPQTYTLDDKSLAGKRKCKSVLQSTLKLDHGPRTPLATMVGRFDADSGFDLLVEVLTPILERNIEVVLMGTGRADIQERLRTMETTFVGRCRLVDGYDVQLAHLIMAGADMLLLPSHYHPSNALCAIAMRYGVVPIGYAKSGLEDYVIDASSDRKNGTGIFFQQYSGDGLIEGVDAVRAIYKNAEQWRRLVRRCLQQDFSWEASAREYLKAYRRVTRRVRTKSKSV